MQEDFADALARVLTYEGGNVSDPHDPGGKTSQGITQGTFNAYMISKKQLMRDVFTISVAERNDIYKTQYWDMIQGDKLPKGLDLVMFDAAVNSGPGQAAKWLQQCLSGVTADGVLGTKTLAALDGCDTHDLIESVCSRRLAMLQSLTTWQYFGKGWAARVANVQKTALAWLSTAPVPMAPDLSGAGGSAKARVADIKPPVVSQITASVATAAASAATVASQAAQQIQPLQDTFGWLKYVFGGLSLVGIGGGVVALLATKAHDAAVAGTATAVVDLSADTNLPAIPEVRHA
jgi:lysozyme family protein